jgi:hypothetical protein
MTEAVMCYERSWFKSQERTAKTEERKPEVKDKRSETIDALLREANDQPQTAKAETAPTKEPAPAK